MKNLLQKLHAFHSNIKPIVKESDNPFFKSKFASLDSIQDHISPTLKQLGLVITQVNTVIEGNAYVKSIVWDVDSGENIESLFPVVVSKPTAQEYGSAVSYAKRYSLTGLLNLTIYDEDDDGNKATASVASVSSVANKNTSNGPDLPWLNENSPEWSKVVESLKSGYTIADVRKKFKVSKAIETKLMSNN